MRSIFSLDNWSFIFSAKIRFSFARSRQYSGSFTNQAGILTLPTDSTVSQRTYPKRNTVALQSGYVGLLCDSSDGFTKSGLRATQFLKRTVSKVENQCYLPFVLETNRQISYIYPQLFVSNLGLRQLFLRAVFAPAIRSFTNPLDATPCPS